MAIGHGQTRRELAAIADSAGLEAATLVHPLSNLAADAKLSPGVACAAAPV